MIPRARVIVPVRLAALIGNKEAAYQAVGASFVQLVGQSVGLLADCGKNSRSGGAGDIARDALGN